eukprot:COSAG01_NODE_10985_length_2033_cov_2.034126_1_plen_93_part_00
MITKLRTETDGQEIPPESLGAYVISMSQSASDVLAVRLLQSEAGVAHPMRVVPLFETLDDLSNAPGIMESLWSTSWYKGDIDGERAAPQHED